MKTLIREALVSSIGTLTGLSRSTISASSRPFPGDEAVDAFLGNGAVDRYIRENAGRCLVIVRDGQGAFGQP